jgi:two-component system chemotaxis response regulator CheY
LVVDDSPAARAHVRSVLAELALSDITESSDGVATAALLEKQTVDLVITDYNMPRLAQLRDALAGLQEGPAFLGAEDLRSMHSGSEQDIIGWWRW